MTTLQPNSGVNLQEGEWGGEGGRTHDSSPTALCPLPLVDSHRKECRSVDLDNNNPLEIAKNLG